VTFHLSDEIAIKLFAFIKHKLLFIRAAHAPPSGAPCAFSAGTRSY
jgi:hypothetical protein